jgi:hypothetical protein
MQTNSLSKATLRFLFHGFILDFFYFPIWWYTKGIVVVGKFFLDMVVRHEKYLGVRIWFKNLFVPMFGQYDWQGRIVSFFVRFANLLARGCAMLIWSVVVLALYILWILLPAIAVYKIGEIFAYHFIFTFITG